MAEALSLQAIDPADIRELSFRVVSLLVATICVFCACAPGDVRSAENHVAYLLPVVATDVRRQNRGVAATSY